MPRPNVIVCLCDQLRAFEVGCYGNQTIRTPNLDRLAAGGVRFETAITNNPVCTPARSALLSGQYSRTCTGALNNVAGTPPARERTRLLDPTLPEALKQLGYRTRLIGKWHIHPDPRTVGFDEVCYPHHSHRHSGQTFFLGDGEGVEEIVVKDYSPEYDIARVEAFLRGPGDEPFFLFYNISPPHMPVYDAPRRYIELYDPDHVPLRPNVWRDGQLAYDENWFKIYLYDFRYYDRHEPYTERMPAGFDLRQLVALYYGMTTWLDDHVGRMVRALEARGLLDDTLLVFTSDHGDNLGSHQLFNKGQLIEESIRIPLIVHHPAGLAPRVVTDGMAQTIDLMPTIVDYVGGSVPVTAQGASLLPVLRGDAPGRDRVFIETPSYQIGVRTPTHVYGMRIDPQSREITDDRFRFHDLRNDPFELVNLAKTETQADVAEDLRRQVADWHRATPWLDVRD